MVILDIRTLDTIFNNAVYLHPELSIIDDDTFIRMIHLLILNQRIEGLCELPIKHYLLPDRLLSNTDLTDAVDYLVDAIDQQLDELMPAGEYYVPPCVRISRNRMCVIIHSSNAGPDGDAHYLFTPNIS